MALQYQAGLPVAGGNKGPDEFWLQSVYSVCSCTVTRVWSNHAALIGRRQEALALKQARWQSYVFDSSFAISKESTAK